MLKQKDPQAYLYLLPAFVLMGIFVIYPLINTVITSFKEGYRFLTGTYLRFSIKNYVDIIKDKTFIRAFMNTAFIAFICVPASMLTALCAALLINSIKRLKGVFMTVFYLPQVTNVIAAGMVFALLFNNNFGFVNLVLGWFGIEPVQWISGVGIAASKTLYNQSYMRCLFVLFVYQIWSGLSLKTLLFLGGLQNINKQLYQAADIDGTRKWKVFSKITLPLLSPTTFYVFITSVITAFKAYSAVISLFGLEYGPAGDNTKMMITMVGYIMDSLGTYLTAGAVSKASAAAVILFVIIAGLTAIQMKITSKKVHYR